METVNHYSETDLGNVAPNPRGEYDPETSYEYLDTVSYQGGSYMCLAELGTTITGTAPDPGHNTDAWQMLTLPGNLTPEYTAMHDNVVNKAAQVEISRAAVEQAQQEVEASQADTQQLHEDTVQAAQDAENSRDSAAGYAQSAEASRKAAAQSEQNINAQATDFDIKVSKSVTLAQEDIATARQQAINAITAQETKSETEVKRVGTAALASAEQALQEIGATGRQAVQAVTDQQNTSVQTVKNETKSYIEEKKQEISRKTDEVTQAVNQAGEEQLQNIADSLDSTFAESGKAADSKAVGDAIVSIEESKANKSALATTDRKLDALWKLNQGITYEFQTDNTEAYQKEIPTGAKMASVKQIGGKTIVWNQLNANSTKTKTANGITFTNNLDGTWTVNGTATDKTRLEVNRGIYALPLTAGHIYLIQGCPEGGDYSSYMIGLWQSGSTKLGQDMGKGAICKATATTNSAGFFITVINSTTIDNLVFRPQLFDLTKMFGSGNEPSTVEEFEAMFPEDYYPYNEGILMSMSANAVVEQGKNLINIPDGQTTSQKYYDVEIPRDVQITVSSKITRSDGGLSRIRLDYKMDEEWKYCAGNSVISGLSYATAVIPREANNTRIAFQFLDNISGTLAYEDTQIELGLKPTAYMPYKKLTLNTISQAILDLPGYGWSAGDARNYIDWENKKYIQRVTAVDLGSLNYNSSEYENHKYFNTIDIAKLISPNTMNTLCKRYSHATANAVIRQENMEIVVDAKGQLFLRDDSMNQDATLLKDSLSGVVLYYELAEPIITDISDILTDDILSALEVEPGGTLTFQNSNGYKVPVPSTVEYAVKLSEVAE
ncbi:MAG: hypothetical protein Q4Q33_08715 [Eubacteriales bacterium]|nr:hypothetical protein [Eubacteriales bacterium]